MHPARLLIETLQVCHPERACHPEPFDSAQGKFREGSALPQLLANAWALADANALIRLAELEGAALWLHRKLKTLGIALPDDAQARLAALARNAIAKSLRVDAETSATFEILRAAEIPFVPLKGAALRRIAARVPYVDARARADVDVLVRAADAQRAWDAFVARGYAARTTEHADGHHLPALFGASGVPVELHVTTVPAVTPADAWNRATSEGATAQMDGEPWPIPSDTELFWHSISHTMATVELAARDGLRLRYWLDTAALIAARADIDWSRVRARIDSAETSRPALARAWVLSAAELAGCDLPDGALGGATVRALNVERVLAWRLQVLARHQADERWYAKLVDEGARGETGLPHGPHVPGDSIGHRLRHGVAVRAARARWRLHVLTS